MEEGISQEAATEISMQVGLQKFDTTLYEALKIAERGGCQKFSLSEDIVIWARPYIVEAFYKDEQIFKTEQLLPVK
jgi:hypothetical protein